MPLVLELIGLFAISLIGLIVVYVAYALRSVKRALLSDDDLEQILVPLPTPGHHISLTHHLAVSPRFKTPVLLCHGLAVNRFNLDLFDNGRGSDRGSLARTLARAGFDVWLLELRGRGRAKVPKKASWTVDDEAREDVPAAIATVLQRTGAAQLLWVGHSKGGIVQFLFQCSGHPLADKVAGIVALGSPGTLQFQRRWLRPLVLPGKMLVRLHGRIPLRLWAPLALPLSGLIHLLGRRFDHAIAANDGKAITRILASLPADISGGVATQFLSWISHAEGRLCSVEGVPYDESFCKMKMPLLLIAGDKDFLVPPAAVEFVRDRVSSVDLTYVVMGKKHGFQQDYGHGDLVVGTYAPDEVFPLVKSWLEAHAEEIDQLQATRYPTSINDEKGGAAEKRTALDAPS